MTCPSCELLTINGTTLMKGETMTTDVKAREIIESWVNGNISWVIDKLASDHPALTALVLVQGSQDRSLSLSDCNSITNLLVDRRIEMSREQVV